MSNVNKALHQEDQSESNLSRTLPGKYIFKFIYLFLVVIVLRLVNRKVPSKL